MPTVTVDLVALFAEVAKSRQKEGRELDGFTTAEYMACARKGLVIAKREIREAKAVGLVVSAKISRPGMDDVWRLVSGYVFKAHGVAE